MKDYIMRWDKATPIKDFAYATTTRFIFDNAVTRFGCPKILMTEQGAHFVNQTIRAMTEEFHIQPKKITPYHPQANGAVLVLNKVLENEPTKVCNTNQDDWDLKIPSILWAYKMTCKGLTRNTPFNLVYIHEAVIPMEYIVPILCIAATTGMSDKSAIKERLAQLL